MKKIFYVLLSFFLVLSVFLIPTDSIKVKCINVLADSPNYNVNFYRDDTLIYSQSVLPGISLDSVNIESSTYPGYTELSYVQANGSQYIDLGIQATSNVTVDIDFMFTSIFNYETILGARGSNSSRIYPVRLQDKKFAIGYGNTQNSVYSSSVTAVTNTRYSLTSVCVPGEQSLTLNNSNILNRTSSSSYSTNNNYYLFANNNQGTAEYFCNARIYSFKLYNNSTLIFDFVPVKRNFDNSIGFLNKVDNTFYSSSSSSSLVAGSVTGSNYSLTLYDYLKINNGVNVWFDSLGNVYNWSTPVTSDLNLYYSSSVSTDSKYSNFITNADDLGINYYNNESLKYVYVKNVSINTIPFNSLIFQASYSGTPEDTVRFDKWDEDNEYFAYEMSVKYEFNEINKEFYVYLIDFKFTQFKSIPLDEFYFDSFYFSIAYMDEPLTLTNVYFAEIIDSIYFEYELNNQYFYNSSFGFSFISGIWQEDVYIPDLFTYNNGGGTVSFIDNSNIYYNYEFDNLLNVDYDDYFILSSSSLNSLYINSIYIDLEETTYYTSSISFDYDLRKVYRFNNYGGNNPILYSGGYNENSLSSTIIPVDSNDLYRPAEWYDIPAQLYNFMIWLIFDAPLISQFAELVYIVIRFIISTFTIIVSLFSKVNNIMFLSLILGFIVLKFVFKIIFGGSHSD